MSHLVLTPLQISYKPSLLTIHEAVTNTVRLSSVSIKSNNSEDLRALGRNGKLLGVLRSKSNEIATVY